MATQTKVTCKVTFDGWDWKNKVEVTSPSGKSITVTAYWGDEVSQELKDMFTFLNDAWQVAKFGTGVQRTSYDLSREAMTELITFRK